MRTLDRITVDPRIMSGQTKIRGMRLTVRRVLQMLAVYPDWQQLRTKYPAPELEDVQQALEFAARNIPGAASPSIMRIRIEGLNANGLVQILRQTWRPVGSTLGDGAAVTVNEHCGRVRRSHGVRHAALAGLVATLVMTGCGGGGGDAPAPAPPPPSGPQFVTPAPQFRASAASPYTADCQGAAASGTAFVNSEVEPHVAVNPRNPDNVIGAWQQDRWSAGAARGVVVAVSQDGAGSWTRISPPFSRCGGGIDERATDPWVSFGADGTAYAMALAVSGVALTANASSAMLVSRSTDGGRSWSPPATLIRDGGDAFNDKNTLTADPIAAGHAYAVWDRLAATGGGPLMLARTTNGGVTWEPARVIFDPGAESQTIGALVVVLPSGALATSFTRIDSVGGNNVLSLWVLRSADKGVTWSAPVKVADMQPVGAVIPETQLAIRDGSVLAQMAAGPAGELYAVWQDGRFSGGRIDAIALSKSTDGGLTWSAPVRLSTVATTQAFTPQVHVAADGTVGVSYFDLRRDTSDAGVTTPTEHWLLRSRDGGATWTETRIAGPFDLMRAPNSRGLFLGDYHGLASIGTSFLAFFAQSTQDGSGNPTDVYALKFAPAAAAATARAAALPPAAASFAGAVSRNVERALRDRQRPVATPRNR